jgi:hypothetical protein
MAKITIKAQKIFGATGPTGVLGQFGSLKAGAPIYSDDPDTIQALNGFGQGIDGAIINSAPPALQDINAMFYLISRQIAYLMQTGVPEWNADTTYYFGSFVSAANNAMFMSVVDDNFNNALSDTSKWMLYDSCKFYTHTVTNSYDVAYDDRFVRMNYAAPSFVYLPEATALNKGRQIHVHNISTASGADSTVSAFGSSLIDGSATILLVQTTTFGGTFATFVSNGVSWDVINKFT